MGVSTEEAALRGELVVVPVAALDLIDSTDVDSGGQRLDHHGVEGIGRSALCDASH